MHFGVWSATVAIKNDEMLTWHLERYTGVPERVQSGDRLVPGRA